VTCRSLEQAHNPDIPASFAALQRAARRAAEVARQTDTALVVAENGQVKLVRPDAIAAEEASSRQGQTP
jgi:hypothetical protein